MSVCIETSLVDAHFEGRISTEQESRLRGHLIECESCTHYYERRLLLAELDPDALGLEDRLGIGLGFGSAPEASRTDRTEGAPSVDLPASNHVSGRARVFGLVAIVAAAAVLVLLLGFFARRPPDEGFASRGGHLSGAPYVRVFQSTKGGVPAPLVGPIHRTSELAFAYESTPDYDTLMIFGLDEHGHVYWYHPAFTDPSSSPSSISVATNAEMHSLEEAIAHELDGNTLEVHALFARQKRTVHEIESILATRRAPSGPLVLPSTKDVVTEIRVLP
jgi:hypothetical protein